MKPIGDIIAEGYPKSYVWFGDNQTPPNNYAWRNTFLSRLSSEPLNYDATFASQKKSLATAIDNTTYSELVTSSEIVNLGDNIFPYSRAGNKQMAMLFGHDTVTLLSLGSELEVFANKDTNTTEISALGRTITISPKLAAAGGNIYLEIQFEEINDPSGVFLIVRRNGVNIFDSPIRPDLWISGQFELVAGTYELVFHNLTSNRKDFSYHAALFMHATEEQMGGESPWGLSQIGGTLPPITMRDALSDLAIENGKYIAIDRHNKITFKDFPSLDELNIVNMENYFVRSKGTKMKAGSPLKSVNNYIQYPEGETGSYSRINIKVDDNRIYAPLTPSSVLKELIHYRVGAFSPSLDLDKLQFEGDDSRLGNALPKFRIFRDTFNNIILYSVEFKNLQEVPEEIMYIPQLNGLFVAEKIIKTSKNKVVINCYKIEKQ